MIRIEVSGLDRFDGWSSLKARLAPRLAPVMNASGAVRQRLAAAKPPRPRGAAAQAAIEDRVPAATAAVLAELEQ